VLGAKIPKVRGENKLCPSLDPKGKVKICNLSMIN